MNAMVISAATLSGTSGKYSMRKFSMSGAAASRALRAAVTACSATTQPRAVSSSAVSSNTMSSSAASLGAASLGAATLGAPTRDAVKPAEAIAVPGIRSGRLQLTRRGRLVFVGIPAMTSAAIVLFASLAIVFGSLASPAHASVEYAPVEMADYAMSVTVLQGDSLWSIASAAHPNGNIREVVREIVALNQLGTGVLQAGQRLYVPIRR